MLFKTAFVLLSAWLLGVFGLYRIGDLVHVLLGRADAPAARRAQGSRRCCSPWNRCGLGKR